MKSRHNLIYGGVVILLIAIAALPLISGSRTLYIRDVFGTHLEMKWVQAEAMRQGRVPEVDEYRAGGQALLGNLNAVPLYPDNLLYLVGSFFWVMNAHFWLHWLLAALAMAWLGRAWGLSREGAWAAAAVYSSSGFLLSNLNFYNLIAGAALAPALVAACLEATASERRRWSSVLVALMWALLVLAGDPIYAVLALALALSAIVARGESRHWRPVVRFSIGIALGTLLVLPQVVEFLRILPLSYRGYWGFSLAARMAASWHPLRILDLFIPMFFGLPSLGFWGLRFTNGDPPLFLSLFPGVVALLLLVLSGRPGRRPMIWWAWGAVVVGFFIVPGAYNPLLWAIAEGPGSGLIRFPAKFWLWIAIGMAVLCGRGLERLLDPNRKRLARWCFVGFGLLYLGMWGTLNLAAGPIEAWSHEVMAKPFNAVLAHPERIRWAGLCLLSMLTLGLTAGVVRALRSRTVWLVVAVLALQVGPQLFLLRPLYESEDVSYYRRPPELISKLPKNAVVVSGAQNDLFGRSQVRIGTYPDLRLLWTTRLDYQRLLPWAGAMYGRHYELNASPEGLDSFLTRTVVEAVQNLPDEKRLRLLAATGAQYLVVDHDLEDVAPGVVDLVTQRAELGVSVHIYRLLRTAPRALFTGNVYPSKSMNEGLNRLLDERFDPMREVVRAGAGEARTGKVGTVEVREWTPRRYVLEVQAPNPGVLTLARALLPLYEARVDGRPVRLLAANLDRMAVEIEQPGRHEVVIELNRRPLLWALLGTVAALLVGGLWWRKGW